MIRAVIKKRKLILNDELKELFGEDESCVFLPGRGNEVVLCTLQQFEGFKATLEQLDRGDVPERVRSLTRFFISKAHNVEVGPKSVVIPRILLELVKWEDAIDSSMEVMIEKDKSMYSIKRMSEPTDTANNNSSLT